MYETDNGTGAPAGPNSRLPERRPFRDLSLHEDLIADGVAAANSQGGAIDHVTARRMALWLVAQQQPTDFTRGLIRFAQSGAITRALKLQLANYARSPSFPHRSKAARLREYAVTRGTDLGPVGTDFGAICDQIDQADTMLADLRERTRAGRGEPEPERPDIVDQQPMALARRDPNSRKVTLVLDAATANIAMFAIAAHADEREAHVREVERFGHSLPEGSYSRRNRQAIAAHEVGVAARLRAVEQAYRTAIDHDTYRAPELTQIPRSPENPFAKQIELEAEP